MIREAAMAWVRSHIIDSRFRLDFSKHYDRSLREGRNPYFAVGPQLTTNGKPYLLHCFCGELFVFELTSAQVRSYALLPNGVMWGMGKIEEKIPSVLNPPVTLSGLEIHRAESLPVNHAIVADVSFDAAAAIGPCVFRLDYEIPGQRGTTCWHYCDEGIYVNSGRITCRFLPVMKPNTPMEPCGPLAMFLRLCTLPESKTPENRQPISNIVGDLVTVVSPIISS